MCAKNIKSNQVDFKSPDMSIKQVETQSDLKLINRNENTECIPNNNKNYVSFRCLYIFSCLIEKLTIKRI